MSSMRRMPAGQVPNSVAACGAAAQQRGRIVIGGGEGRGRVVFISRRFQSGGIPVHEYTLIRQAEDHALVAEAAVLAVHGAAVLVAKIARRITHRRQIVRDAVRAGDSDIALALAEGAGEHRAGVVLALRIDIAARLGGVGCGGGGPYRGGEGGDDGESVHR